MKPGNQKMNHDQRDISFGGKGAIVETGNKFTGFLPVPGGFSCNE
jgi:hypothetical protein